MSADGRVRPPGAHRLRRGVLAVLLAGCLGGVGCGGSEPDPELPEGGEITLEALGRLGGEIYNEPERAEEILEGAGLTSEAFEERVRKITNDPVLAREYSRGFEAVARPPAPPTPVDSAPSPPLAAPDTGAGSGGGAS